MSCTVCMLSFGVEYSNSCSYPFCFTSSHGTSPIICLTTHMLWMHLPIFQLLKNSICKCLTTSTTSALFKSKKIFNWLVFMNKLNGYWQLLFIWSVCIFICFDTTNYNFLVYCIFSRISLPQTQIIILQFYSSIKHSLELILGVLQEKSTACTLKFKNSHDFPMGFPVLPDYHHGALLMPFPAFHRR